jgi:uncharacterized membrane protein (DUF373 family)
MRDLTTDETFLKVVTLVIGLIAKVLSLLLIGIVIVSVMNLAIVLTKDLLSYPPGAFSVELIQIFGLFLDILIAIELLENITGYLRSNSIQVELVVVTALVAVARKVIIFDFEKFSAFDLLGLASAILSLSISYWLVRLKRMDPHPD